MSILPRQIVILVLTLALAGRSSAQKPEIPVDEVTRKITYKEVVQEKGNSDSLYVRAIEWCDKYFPNAQGVTRTRDREDKVIRGIHRFKVYFSDKDGNRREGPLCEYSFAIECREGRYRYTLTDFTSKEASRQPYEKYLNLKDPAYNPQWDSYLAQVDAFVKEWSSSLKEGMKPPVIRKDEW